LYSPSKIVKFKEVLTAWIVGGIENDVFGNRLILAEYAGVNHKRVIPGRLQHGWAFNQLYYKNNLIDTFVWDYPSRVAANNNGWRNFWDIGAPWLYLLEILKRDGWKTNRNYIGSHSINELWVFGNHTNSDGNHASSELPLPSTELINFLRYARNSIEPNSLVLLYFSDFDSVKTFNPELLEGLEVVTLGQRNASATSRAHLFRIFHLLSSTNTIVLDYPTTLFFYAATLDCNIKFLDVPALETAKFTTLQSGNIRLHEILSQQEFRGGELRDFALNELGYQSMKTPHELRRLFDWTENSIDFLARGKRLFSAFLWAPPRFYRSLTKDKSD
jgi:hypothetical protein